MMSRVKRLPLDSITPGQNDRKQFSEQGLRELAESMRNLGLQQPILVRPIENGFEIVAGERRWRAARLIGWQEIECVVKDLDDESAAMVMLTENMARQDLNPIEEAQAYKARMDRFGWQVHKLAEVAGVSQDRVRGRLELLNLVPEAQRLVAQGQMPITQGRIISELDSNRQRLAIRLITSGRGVTSRELSRYVADLLAEQRQEAMWDLTLFWIEQVEKEVPLRGGQAKVDVPVAEDLPEPIMQNDMTAGEIIYSYIRALQQEGYDREAAAIGRLYAEMVRFNSVGLPREGASQT